MIFIALGSSLGDAEAIFASTEVFLNSFGITILKKSKNFTNPPIGGVAQNDFVNAVWEIRWPQGKDLKSALKLLEVLQNCEKSHGRERKKKGDDRTLDLDIIVFHDLISQSKKLTLPHPEAKNRVFVLKPWCEIIDEKVLIPTFGSPHKYLHGD